MLIHKKTGMIFENRKQAKLVMGQGRFKRLAQHDELEYIFDSEDKDNKIAKDNI